MKKQPIIITSDRGYDLMALKYAESFSSPAWVIPTSSQNKEYAEIQKEITDNLSFFSSSLIAVPFEIREKCRQEAINLVDLAKSGQLPAEIWNRFFEQPFKPDLNRAIAPFPVSSKQKNILFVPQKSWSDNRYGITAVQKSLPPSVFSFLKNSPEHQLLGVQNTRHADCYQMYASVDLVIGIAGTHTWYFLTTLPWVPHIILYHKDATGWWPDIGTACQKRGYPIIPLGFNAETDLNAFSEQIRNSYEKLIAL